PLVTDIEKYRLHDDGFEVVAAFEINCLHLIPTRQFKGRLVSKLGNQAQNQKICDRTFPTGAT
ncbi:MAG: hypothetical protein ACKVKF_05325, partial [Rhodobacterales bacterium]